jgi:molybdopterin molybdotransferase
MLSLESLAQQFPGYDPDNLRVDMARAIVLRAVARARASESVALREALGRVLAGDIVSPIDVPAHDNAAMDGYAVRAQDLRANADTVLTVTGTALAGRPHGGALGAGECVRIMTGAVIPAGADTVVMQEVVRVEGSRVAIPPGQKPGQNCRRAGEDLAAGRPALAAGICIGPAELGLLASLGLAEVDVRERLRVAVFSTGDELREPHQLSGPGSLYDSNRHALLGMLARLGCLTVDLGMVADDPALIESRFREGVAAADLVITSGGASVGDADFTVPMMARLGQVLQWKLAMRPGRPLAFGRIRSGEREAWLFGLPGNPVAALVACCQFVRPAVLAMTGQRDRAPPPIPARLRVAIRKKPGRTEFQRGVLEFADGMAVVRPTANQGSGVLSSMSEANCLIALEPERGDVAAGELVLVQLFAGLF